MVRSLTTCFAAALGLTLAASAAGAQTIPHRHHTPRYSVAVRPGDIVVHAGRSYLDPGPATWNEVGNDNRYVGDTTPSSFTEFGGALSARPGAYEVLPSRFNPPGQPEPLFVF
jgi:hypothetical protein